MRRYQTADWETIRTWKDLPFDYIPKVGFYVPDVAVGFLVQTDTKYCFLEPFIGNPKSDKEVRDLALYTIMDALLREAKELKYDLVLGIADHPTMLRRAFDMGFNRIVGEHSLIGRKL